jgi:hypothetical protein
MIVTRPARWDDQRRDGLGRKQSGFRYSEAFLPDRPAWVFLNTWLFVAVRKATA